MKGLANLVERTFPYLDETAGAFESLWFPDHVQYGSHNVGEGWSLLAYALARYPDKICGHDVLCNSFRNPSHLAKMTATMQAISGGRVVLGIGAGWNEEEYTAYGWPFPSAKIRIEQLGEAIELIRLMWKESPATYEGKHYQLQNAYCEPRPETIPPIMVGGAGERYLLRVVAQHADWWSYVYKDGETYAHKQAVLKEHCAAVGRDYETIEHAIHVGVLIAESDAEIARLQTLDDVRPTGENDVVGTPDQVADQLLAIAKQGAHRLTIHFCDAPRPDGTLLFAERVLPALSGL